MNIHRHITIAVLVLTLDQKHSRTNGFQANIRTSHQNPLKLKQSVSSDASTAIPIEETDVVVIGSGLAGLSCAALLSHCKTSVKVLESHDTPGGCAHTWERKGYHFESGPS